MRSVESYHGRPMHTPLYDLRTVTLKQVRDLCERFHCYASVGNAATYSFGRIRG